MKIKEYLVNRILELEEELKQVRNEKIEQYQIEREHIKEIITCNIVEDIYCDGIYEIDLNSTENDFKTLMAILGIKPEDYDNKEVTPNAENTD